MTTTRHLTDWPYDADQHDPLALWRIPVTTLKPEYAYLTAFNRDSPARPTHTETLIIASYITWRRSLSHDQQWQLRALQQPFDINISSLTVILHKHGEDDWAYRRSDWDWTYGLRLNPAAPTTPANATTQAPPPYTLVQLLDRIHERGAHRLWNNWKTTHPDVFAGTQA